MERLIFLLCIIVFLQCSNGDSTSETPYSEISIDYVYPKNNATDVPINHQILLYFSQEINPDELRKKVTLSTETDSKEQQIWYNVQRYQNLTTHETLSAYKICVIKPSNLLEENKEYKLTLNKEMLSTEHGKLKETFTYTFTTAQGIIPERGIYDGKDLQRHLLIKEEYNNDIIKLWYNEQLNPYYVNKKSVLLSIEDTPIGVASIQYDPHKACIIIYPENTLETGIEYMVRLARFTDEIYDLGGNDYTGGEDLPFTLE